MLEDSSLAFSLMKRDVLEHCGRWLQRGGTADQMTEFSVGCCARYKVKCRYKVGLNQVVGLGLGLD